MTSLSDILVFNFKLFEDDGGFLVPVTGNEDFPFPIKRVFYVYGPLGGKVRGDHAHHKCEQVLIALQGSLEVTCHDGTDEKTYLLDTPNKAIYVPAGVWSKEKYYCDKTILMAFCSKKYAKADYINDFSEYLEWKNS